MSGRESIKTQGTVNKATAEIRELVIELSEGNPGAINVMMQLAWFTKWQAMLEWFRANNIKGSKIWMLYKDDHGCDLMSMANYIQRKMNENHSANNGPGREHLPEYH